LKRNTFAQNKPITSESNVNLLVTILRFFRGEKSSQPFTLWEAQQSWYCLICDSWWVHNFYSRWV